MEEVWESIAGAAPEKLGNVAYAKRQAAMWARMRIECRRKFREAGYNPDLEKGEILADRVAAVRAADAELFARQVGGIESDILL